MSPLNARCEKCREYIPSRRSGLPTCSRKCERAVARDARLAKKLDALFLFFQAEQGAKEAPSEKAARPTPIGGGGKSIPLSKGERAVLDAFTGAMNRALRGGQ